VIGSGSARATRACATARAARRPRSRGRRCGSREPEGAGRCARSRDHSSERRCRRRCGRSGRALRCAGEHHSRLVVSINERPDLGRHHLSACRGTADGDEQSLDHRTVPFCALVSRRDDKPRRARRGPVSRSLSGIDRRGPPRRDPPVRCRHRSTVRQASRAERESAGSSQGQLSGRALLLVVRRERLAGLGRTLPWARERMCRSPHAAHRAGALTSGARQGLNYLGWRRPRSPAR
jgi:hypothetical protein